MESPNTPSEYRYMDPRNVLRKDRSIFVRDDYTCLLCGADGDCDSLWVAPFGEGRTRGTVCTDCARASIERIFGEGQRGRTDHHNLRGDNVGLQAERYLDETFASFFRWLFRLPLRATILLVKFCLLPFYAAWLYLEKTGSIEAFREGYEDATSEEIEIE